MGGWGERAAGRLGVRRRLVTVGALVLALACGSLSAQAAPTSPSPSPASSKQPTGTASASSSPGTGDTGATNGAAKDASGASKGSDGDDDAKKKSSAASAADEPTTDHPVYAYDAADRLVGVTDPDGETARYRYDEVGNRLGVDRYASSALSVLSVVPARAAAGTQVTLSGTGFSTTASSNTVAFGDVRATVTSASATRLTVTVPTEAADGKVSVTVGQDTVESTESFTVAAGAPAVSGITPTSGVPGDRVVLSGSGFAANATDNVVRFNGGTAAHLVSATPTSVTVDVPPGATTGRIEVSTPDGRAVSDGDFTVPLGEDDFETTVRTSVTDDDPPSAVVTQDGGRARVLFDAERGDSIGFGFTESTFSSSVDLTLVDPSGQTVSGPTYVGFIGGGDWEVQDLPLAGTYSLVLDPSSDDTGAVTVTVSKQVGGELDLTGRGGHGTGARRAGRPLDVGCGRG